MTKTVASVGVVIIVMAGFYTSVMTSLRTNQEASTSLIVSLDKNREIESELYKRSEDEAIKRILSLLDRTQESIKGAVDQNVSLSQNILSMSKSIDDVSKQMNQVLGEHTKTLEEAKAKAAEAAVNAKKDQVTTQRTLKEITKPKKSWWSGIFTTPTPAPRGRH